MCSEKDAPDARGHNLDFDYFWAMLAMLADQASRCQGNTFIANSSSSLLTRGY